MIVTVLGKEIKKGKSNKTGRDIDGCVIHTKYIDEKVDGEAVGTFWVSTNRFIPQNIELGQNYNMIENKGYAVVLEPIGEPDDDEAPF